MKRDLLGVVLCGGKSSRMGADKASIEVRPGVSQLEYQLGLLEPFCSRLAVCVGPARSSVNRTLRAGVECVYDLENASGPMSGLVAALRAAGGLPVLAIACDMPYLETSHLVQILNRRNPDRLGTSFLAEDGMPDPMCSIYEPAALAELEGLAAVGKLSLRRFLAEASIERIDTEKRQFLASVNDPEQLERARRALG